MADITVTIKEDDKTATITGEGVVTMEARRGRGEDYGLPSLGAPDHLESFTRIDWTTRDGAQCRLTVEYHVPSKPGVMFNARDKARGESRRFVTLDNGDLLNVTTCARMTRHRFDMGYRVIGDE